MKKQALYNDNMLPTLESVKLYFSKKGMSELEAEHFYTYNQMQQWRNRKGNFFTNWKSVAYRWIMSALRSQPWLFNKDIH